MVPKTILKTHSLQGSNRLLLLSLLVGVCCGLASVILNVAIKKLGEFVSGLGGGAGVSWQNLLFPGIGMLVSLLVVRYLVKDDIGHGVTRVLQAVSSNESRIKPHNTWSSMLTSAITIGFGGSAGAEAPIVYTGAAIGSNIGTAFKLSHREVTILVGCGAAGAIAGVFKAPLAGVLFTLEILLFNVSMTSMTPLLISTLSSTIISYIFLGRTAPFACELGSFAMRNLPYYLLLGVVCAFVGLYFTRTTLWLEDFLSRLKNVYLKWLICASLLGVLILLFPPLYGEGYDVLRSLLNGTDPDFAGGSPLEPLLNSQWSILLFFLAVMLIKLFSMTLTNSGGGVGGTFGPTLFIGGILGFLVAKTLNLSAGLSLPVQNFALVGMAGLMASVMQAPMTAIILVAELSGCYSLLLPLAICATISFYVNRIWEKYSIYTKRIAQNGELLTHDDDQAVLTLLKTKNLVSDKYPKVHPEDTLQKLVSEVAVSTAAVVAVIDAGGHFKGYVNVEDARVYLFNSQQYKGYLVKDIMTQPKAFVYEDERMELVMEKFNATKAWRLPVITEDNVYLGFISRSRILNAYRERLKEFSQD